MPRGFPLTGEEAVQVGMRLMGKMRADRSKNLHAKLKTLRIVGDDSVGPYDLTFTFELEPLPAPIK